MALAPPHIDDVDVDDALNTLQTWRFVRYDRGEERYSIDAMVQLSLPAPDDPTRRMHFQHYHSLHSDYDRNRAHAEDGSMLWHRALTRDWENIHTALEWGLAHEPKQAVDWVIALQAYMLLHQTHQERFVLLTQALSAAQASADVLAEASCLDALGDVQYR